MEKPTSTDSYFVGKVLSLMAARLSAELSTFAGWMLTGFGALLGLILTNIESVSKFVPASSIGSSISIFLSAVVLHVVQRYLASIVASSTAIGKEIESIPAIGEINIQFLLRELEASTLWPTRLLVKWSNAKIREGDLAVGGRVNAVIAQLQAWMVFSQLILIIWAAYTIAKELHG